MPLYLLEIRASLYRAHHLQPKPLQHFEKLGLWGFTRSLLTLWLLMTSAVISFSEAFLRVSLCPISKRLYLGSLPPITRRKLIGTFCTTNSNKSESAY